MAWLFGVCKHESMPLGAIIPVVIPFFAVVLFLYLRYLYGDSLFESHGFTRNLNDPEDTRLLKLNLRTPPDQQPRDSSSRRQENL